MLEQVTYRELLEGMPTLTAALERSFRLGGMSPSEAAWAVGIEYNHFSRMFREGGGRHFPPDLILPLMRAAGNKLPLHWLAHQMGEATYPLEFISILAGIRETLTQAGLPARFALLDEGVEKWLSMKG